MPRTPLLGYLQSAIADNTGQSDMDKLLFEDEMSNIQKGTKGYQQGGSAERFNIPSILGKIKRKNPEWTGEAGERAGEIGVSIRGYPEWMQKVLEKTSGRPVTDFALGNTIFMGGGEKPYTGLRKAMDTRSYWKDPKYYPGTSIPFPSRLTSSESEIMIQDKIKRDIENELPHIQQFREEGLLGFLGKHVKDLLKYGTGEETYWKKGTHESFHYKDPEEQQRLLTGIGWDSPDPELESRQQGGPAERAPLLGYMNPSIQDETAHSQMDRLIFENKMSNIRPEWGTISNPDEGYDPAREWGEGMMPIGGAMKLLKGSKEWPDLVKAMAQSSLRDKRKMEVINNARNIFGKKIDAGGADEATRQYLESKWMEKVIQ